MAIYVHSVSTVVLTNKMMSTLEVILLWSFQFRGDGECT